MYQLNMDFEQGTTSDELLKPAGYKGLYGFHKYWGKKPAETVRFLIEQLSERDDLVLDPFLGSGAVAREALMRKRRVIAGDLNPAAIELASLVVNPPSAADLRRSLEDIEANVRRRIEESYQMPDGLTATHYLWQGNDLRKVWSKGNNRKSRIEFAPTAADWAGVARFCEYQPMALRPLRLFRNSRINSFTNMQWRDLFTGRAVRNIELLRDAILKISDLRLRRALLMILTASSGQMSRMVFAIEKRGKKTGDLGNGRIEVGSWVIGFWRPELHFEINAWNCFDNKARALLRGLDNESDYDHSPRLSKRPADVVERRAQVSLVNRNATELLAGLPEGSVDLLITDPPHGDRIPYLELSEIWNAILDREPPFEDEIVVSNAVERGHTSQLYSERMARVFRLAERALSPNGRMAVMFNSRSDDDWRELKFATEAGRFTFCGGFPMAYSAGSVVQDNRNGALRHDYVLLFVPSRCANSLEGPGVSLTSLPNWIERMPITGDQ